MTYGLKVFTTDGNVHEFQNVNTRTHDGVLIVEKNPRSYTPEYVQFPLVNVLRWETEP